MTQRTFNYLDGREGRLIAIFYGSPNRDIVNSLTIFILDPRYEDSKMVIVELKEILDIGPKTEWINQSHQVTITTVWKEREEDSCTPFPTQTNSKMSTPKSTSST